MQQKCVYSCNAEFNVSIEHYCHKISEGLTIYRIGPNRV